MPTLMHIYSKNGEVIDIVNKIVYVWIRVHVINCLKETAPGPGFHVNVVAQLLSTETMTNAIMSPVLYMVKYLFIYIVHGPEAIFS